MKKSWQLQEAKNRLSELVDEAQKGPAQIITRRGREAAVVLSFEEYRKLVRSERPLVDILRRAPRMRGGLDVERSKDTGRETAL